MPDQRIKEAEAMDKEEARPILGTYRPEEQDKVDSLFAEALEEVARDPELARRFAEAFAIMIIALPI